MSVYFAEQTLGQANTKTQYPVNRHMTYLLKF